jgi:hypothetical protein
MTGDFIVRKTLTRIYLVLSSLAIPSLALIYFLRGAIPAISALAGLLFLAGMLVSWQVTAKFMVREDPPGWTPLVIIFRYILLGGLFYAIIHGRLVLWDWFVLGSVLVILAITFSTLLEIKTK